MEDREWCPAGKEGAKAVVHGGCWLFGSIRAAAMVRKAVPIVHGPRGCAYTTQERLTYFHACGSPYPLAYRVWTTDTNRDDIIFGGGKKLEETIHRAYEKVREYPLHPMEYGPPELIFVFGTCPTDMIGDDLEGVAARAEKNIGGGVRVLAMSAAGFQSSTYGNNGAYEKFYDVLLNKVMVEPKEKRDDTINILGEHRPWAIETEEVKGPLERLGIRVNAVLTSHSSVESIARAPEAALNAVRCEATTLKLAQDMEQRFGVPYFNLGMAPIGIDANRVWVVAIGSRFGKEKEARELAEIEVEKAEKRIAEAKRFLAGKRTIVFSRPGHSIAVYKFCLELGMEVLALGVGGEDKRAWQHVVDIAQEKGLPLPIDMGLSEYAAVEELFSTLHPDVVIAGTPERVIAQRLGLRFLHIMRYEEPWYGFNGAVKFVRDLCRTLGAPIEVELPPEIAKIRDKVYPAGHPVQRWYAEANRGCSGAGRCDA